MMRTGANPVKVQWAENSWPVISEAAERGSVVVVPTGSIEQHGPHLPLDTDSFLVATIAERSASRAVEHGTPALVLPPIWTGYSPHHMDFVGTLTLSADTFLGLVTDIASSLWQHGFRKLLFLNGHGGNANLLNSAIQILKFEKGVRAVTASYWSFATEFIGEWRESARGGIDHACEMETSLMLALRPDLVRIDKLRDGTWFPHSEFLTGDLMHGAPVGMAWTLSELTGDGTLGDAARGDAQRGSQLLDEIAGRVSEFIIEFHGWRWNDPRSI